MNAKWNVPPVIKAYEALGSLGDGRVEIDGNSARVRSSSGNRTYDVAHDPDANAIRSNDNGSYWQKYLGYPAIAYLLGTGLIAHDPKWDEALKDIPWKDMNRRLKNDFAKAEAEVRDIVAGRGYRLGELDAQLASIMARVNELDLAILRPLQRPPSGE